MHSLLAYSFPHYTSLVLSFFILHALPSSSSPDDPMLTFFLTHSYHLLLLPSHFPSFPLPLSFSFTVLYSACPFLLALLSPFPRWFVCSLSFSPSLSLLLLPLILLLPPPFLLVSFLHRDVCLASERARLALSPSFRALSFHRHISIPTWRARRVVTLARSLGKAALSLARWPTGPYLMQKGGAESTGPLWKAPHDINFEILFGPPSRARA